MRRVVLTSGCRKSVVSFNRRVWHFMVVYETGRLVGLGQLFGDRRLDRKLEAVSEAIQQRFRA